MTGAVLRREKMFSKETETMGLPQWQPKDHPDFLTDMNEAFSKIDNEFSKLDLATPEKIDEVAKETEQNSKDIDILKNRTEQQKDSIDQLADNVSTLADSSAEHTKDIADNAASISALESETNDNKLQITAVKGQITQLNDLIMQVSEDSQTKDSEQDTEISTLRDAINTNTETLLTQDSTIESIKTVNSIQSGDINILNGKVNTHDSILTAYGNQISSLSSRVSDLEDTEQDEDEYEYDIWLFDISDVGGNIYNSDPLEATISSANHVEAYPNEITLADGYALVKAFCNGRPAPLIAGVLMTDLYMSGTNAIMSISVAPINYSGSAINIIENTNQLYSSSELPVRIRRRKL